MSKRALRRSGSRFSRADRHEHRYQKYHRNKVTDPRQWAVIDDTEATEDCSQDTSPEQHGDPADIIRPASFEERDWFQRVT